MPESTYYITALILSLAGLALADYRYKLAYFSAPRRTLKTISAVVGLFIIWDLLGIGLGIFYEGTSRYLLGVNLLPEFPIEELFFLTLLIYTTLLLVRGTDKSWSRT